MKILPCVRCEDGKARVSERELYWISRYPGPQYRCSGCGKAYRITPAEFARIPPASRQDLEQGGALDAMAKDLVGQDAGELELAKQRIVAGISPEIIRAKARPIDRKVGEQ